MAEKNVEHQDDRAEVVMAKAKDFWTRHSKAISVTCLVVVLGVAGYFIYTNYFKKPKMEKAWDAMYKAEEYFRMDSLNQALKGDGRNSGFLKIIDNYGGTPAGNLARYYAGAAYLKLDDYNNAIKHLKEFSTSSKPVKAEAYEMLGYAYAGTGKNSDAVDYFKKAAGTFDVDKDASSAVLNRGAYFLDRVMKDQKSAAVLYKEVVEKFPNTPAANEATKYLAQMGIFNED